MEVRKAIVQPEAAGPPALGYPTDTVPGNLGLPHALRHLRHHSSVITWLTLAAVALRCAVRTGLVMGTSPDSTRLDSNQGLFWPTRLDSRQIFSTRLFFNKKKHIFFIKSYLKLLF